MTTSTTALATCVEDAIAATRRGDLPAATALLARVALGLPPGVDRSRALTALALLHAKAGRATRAAELHATLGE